MLELTKHIESLLFKNDCVIIPFLGGFVTHYMPATYKEDEELFIPPYRSIGFNPLLTMNDGLLVQSYMQVHDTNYPETLKLIEDDVKELKSVLQTEGKCDIEGVGRLVLKLNGVYEFVPFESGIPSPELYGLVSFPIPYFIPGSEEECIPTETTTSEDSINETGIGQTRRDNYTIRINRQIANVCIAAIAAFAFYFIWSNNIGEVSTSNVKEASVVNNLMFGISKSQTTPMTSNATASFKVPKVSSSADTEESKTSPVAEAEPGEYSLVLASAITMDNANLYVHQLKKQGYSDALVYKSKRMVRVLYSHYKTESEAYAALGSLHHKRPFKDAWVISIK